MGGCWSQSMKEQVFEQFPFVDVAFGPGQIAQARRVPDQSDEPDRAGLLRVRGLHRPPADEARARLPGLDADLGRVQLRRARTASCRPRAGARRAARRPSSCAEVERLAARRRARGHAARPERELLRPRPAQGRSASTSPSCSRWWTPSRASSASATRARTPRTCARTWWRRTRELPSAVRAHPPAAAVGLQPDPEGDAPHVRPRALHGAGGDDPRARARLARSRPTSSSGFPGETEDEFGETLEVVERGGLRLRVHLHLLAAPRHRGGRRCPTRCPHEVKRERMERLRRGGAATRARARAAVRGPTHGGAGRGPEPHRRGAPARAHPPQQDRQLHRAGAARASWSHVEIDRRDQSRRSAGCRAPALARRLARGRTGDRDLRPDRRRQDRVARRSWPSCCASAARTRWPCRPTRSQVYEGLDVLTGAPSRASGRGWSTGWSRFVPLDQESRAGRYTELAHAEIDDALDVRAARRSWSAAPASTCGPR